MVESVVRRCVRCGKERKKTPCEHCGDDGDVFTVVAASGDYREDEDKFAHQAKSDGTSED